jgi:hypothetical protein
VIDDAIYTLSSCPLCSLLCVTAIESNAPNTLIVKGHQVHCPPHERTHATKTQDHLLEGNETGRVSGTNTGPSVLYRLAVWLLASLSWLVLRMLRYAL